MIDRFSADASLRLNDQDALLRLPSDYTVRRMFRVVTGVAPESPIEIRRKDNEKARQVVDLAGFLMVGVARIELATPAMSTQCSTTELYAHTAGPLAGRSRYGNCSITRCVQF
jgi:hypothetical protein